MPRTLDRKGRVFLIVSMVALVAGTACFRFEWDLGAGLGFGVGIGALGLAVSRLRR
jgi:hypothetical protein